VQAHLYAATAEEVGKQETWNLPLPAARPQKLARRFHLRLLPHCQKLSNSREGQLANFWGMAEQAPCSRNAPVNYQSLQLAVRSALLAERDPCHDYFIVMIDDNREPTA